MTEQEEKINTIIRSLLDICNKYKARRTALYRALLTELNISHSIYNNGTHIQLHNSKETQVADLWPTTNKLHCNKTYNTLNGVTSVTEYLKSFGVVGK